MVYRHWSALSLLIVLLVNSISGTGLRAKIEADPSKVYSVTKQHGPWMIMVTSLRGDDDTSAAAANKAAQALVLELRQKGIPAYVYSQSGELEEIASFDRNGKTVKRFVAAQRNRVCVLAGNYRYGNSPEAEKDAKLAESTLAWIQKFHPKALESGSYRPTPGRPGPLSRAFLTFNPLLSEEEIKVMALKSDPLIRTLNADREYNLLDNKAKYTLVVATFSGASQHVVTGDRNVAAKAARDFEQRISKRVTLDDAAENAWKLVRTLRHQEKMEAWIFHDQYRSVVTIGSFDSPNDPRIVQLQQKFGAKVVKDPRTRQDVTVVENIRLKGKSANEHQGEWMFDAFPQLMNVPKIN